MIKITNNQFSNGSHLITVTSPDETEDGVLGNCDSLHFTFDAGGLTVDGVENGVVVGTRKFTFTEIVDQLKDP